MFAFGFDEVVGFYLLVGCLGVGCWLGGWVVVFLGGFAWCVGTYCSFWYLVITGVWFVFGVCILSFVV